VNCESCKHAPADKSIQYAQCFPGTYSHLTSAHILGPTACVNSTAGRYCIYTPAVPRASTAARSTSRPAALGYQACQQGTYQQNEGQVGCTHCAPGSYGAFVASSGCYECTKGRFGNETGQSCAFCEPGSATSGSGSGHVSYAACAPRWCLCRPPEWR
jgi:hypothetical protein